jgi:hypothetical protein
MKIAILILCIGVCVNSFAQTLTVNTDELAEEKLLDVLVGTATIETGSSKNVNESNDTQPMAFGNGTSSFNDCLNALNTMGNQKIKGHIWSLNDDGSAFATLDGSSIKIHSKKGESSINQNGQCSSVSAFDSGRSLADLVINSVGFPAILNPKYAHATQNKGLRNIWTICNNNPTLKKYLDSYTAEGGSTSNSSTTAGTK